MPAWVRMAGSRRYHMEREDWVRTGRAVCGAAIPRPYSEYAGAGHPTQPEYVRLAAYPAYYGKVMACGHCLKVVGKG